MSGYTSIESDIPVSGNMDYSNPPSYNEHTQTQTQPNQSNQFPQNSGQNSTQNNQPNVPTTLYERLKESSHPVALFFYILFRVAPIVVYIFGNFFIGFITKRNKFILHFITLILLNAADFWNLKNVSGRLLVGLRWWNEVNQVDQSGNFENVWVFETADPNRYINPIDSKVFWILLYAQPGAWILLGVLSLLELQFLYLLFILISVSLSLTNTIAFTRCDKFGKANVVANNLFSRASAGLFSRFNPFA